MSDGGPPRIMRKAAASDSHFIVQTWLFTGRRYANRTERRAGFVGAYRAIILDCVARSASSGGLWLCAAYDDPSHILGYVVAEPGIVHFAYVRKWARRCGLASSLIQHVTAGHKDVVCTWPARGWAKDWARNNRWDIAPMVPYFRILSDAAKST